jgi:hypothetical protein
VPIDRIAPALSILTMKLTHERAGLPTASRKKVMPSLLPFAAASLGWQQAANGSSGRVRGPRSLALLDVAPVHVLIGASW